MSYQIGPSISFSIPKEIAAKARKQEDFLAQRGITEGGFREAVERNIKEKGISFILAVYQTFDEFLEQERRLFGIELVCKKGCSACCYTMITCSEMEMDEIVKYVKAMPRTIRRPLIRELQKAAIKWQNYYEKQGAPLLASPFQVLNDWQGKPCPFLNRQGGYCQIYSVRIIDCRTMTSLVPCDFTKMNTAVPCELLTQGPGRHRFRCESWATNLIIKRQQTRATLLSNPVLAGTTPIHHWLCIKKF